MSATVWQALRASASPTGETDGRVPFPAPETAPQDQAARLRSRGQRGASAVQRPDRQPSSVQGKTSRGFVDPRGDGVGTRSLAVTC